ncbi:pyrimidine/purine nucleoside phosphorylase, partial [Enterococcus sp. S181_ASV_20]|nr:pyrimidine/purine nucleoside phosphorylase [Enterococcus sp. S181_ASV_20]
KPTSSAASDVYKRQLLPNEESWKTVSENEEFIVPANSAFQVKVEKYADYTCFYVSED